MFTRNLLGWLLDRATDSSTNHPDRQFRDRLQVLTNLRDREQPLHCHLDNLMRCYHDVIIAAERLRFDPGLDKDAKLLLDSELASLIIAAEAARKAVWS